MCTMHTLTTPLGTHQHLHLKKSPVLDEGWRGSLQEGGKCRCSIWIQPFPLQPEKLFNSRKAAHELLKDVLFAVTWIMGRQAQHMYPSCSVHWVMQAARTAETQLFHVVTSSLSRALLPPPNAPPCRLSTGIAVDKNGLIYFVDGTTIRKVDQNGIISTFLGSNDLTSARPLTCDNSMDINQVIYTGKGREWEKEVLVNTGMACTHRAYRSTPAFCPRSHLTASTHPWLITCVI